MAMPVESALKTKRVGNILDIDCFGIGIEWVKFLLCVGEYPVHKLGRIGAFFRLSVYPPRFGRMQSGPRLQKKREPSLRDLDGLAA